MAGFELQEELARPAEAPAGPISPDELWSPLERWIWDKLKGGAIANIDEYEDEHGRLPPADPKRPEDWQDGRRRLTPCFFEDLLLREPYCSGVHRKGVRIEAAWFDEEIDLSMAELVHPLWLDRCRFEKAADLKYLRTSTPLSLDGSSFAAQLNLQGTCIEANLFVRNGTAFKDVVLNSAKVGGQVDLIGAKVAGSLNMASIDIGQSLLMRSASEHGAEFNEVILNSAKVAGHVELTGAKVSGMLNMDSADIGQSLLMASDRNVSKQQAEFCDVVLRGAKIGGQVALIGAKIAATLEMASTDIGQSLLMRSDRRVSENQAEFNDVVLNGATVGGQVDIIGAKVAGTLNMDSANIGQSLYMASDHRVSEKRAEFNEVILRGAKIGGQVSLIGAKVAATINMDSADIGRSLFMGSDREVSEQRAEFNNVVLRGAKVVGQVDLSGTKVAGTLDLDSADIGQSLFMRSDRSVSGHCAEFAGGVTLIFAEIGRNLDIRDAILSSLDLTGTRVGGELRLASRSWSPQWQNGGKLVLRNASIDAIQDTDERGVWPSSLDLDGFTYRRLGGLGANAEAGVAKRGSRWFFDWLAKDEPYTPGPYQQCAQVLREMGHPEMANDVLYAGRERERKEAWRTGNNPRGTGLTLLKWFVGYGYGQRLLWHPVAWVVALVAAGTAVLHLAGVPNELAGSGASVVAYSFDMLLPIVELEKDFAEIVLHGFAKYYFYFQKLMGWVLASFLIAGLSGLTK